MFFFWVWFQRCLDLHQKQILSIDIMADFVYVKYVKHNIFQAEVSYVFTWPQHTCMYSIVYSVVRVGC